MLKSYIFQVIVRKDAENAYISKIEFLELGISIDVATLSDQQRVLLNTCLHDFLHDKGVTKIILDELERMDKNDEAIKPLTPAETHATFPLGPYDRLEPTTVKFAAERRYDYCERFLPPVMKMTLAVEFTLFMPLLAAAIGNSEIELFSADKTTAEGTGMMMGVLFTAYNMINTFAGPGAGGMNEFGETFDEALHSIGNTLWNTLTCKKSNSTKNMLQQLQDPATRAKKFLAKTGITIFCGTYLFSDFLMNSQQYKSMEAQVSAMAPYTFFSEAVILYAMKINFYLNQINDPIYASSFVAWNFRQIDNYYAKKSKEKTNNTRLALPVGDTETGNSLSDKLLSPDDYKSINDDNPPDQPWHAFFTRLGKTKKPDVVVKTLSLVPETSHLTQTVF